MLRTGLYGRAWTRTRISQSRVRRALILSTGEDFVWHFRGKQLFSLQTDQWRLSHWIHHYFQFEDVFRLKCSFQRKSDRLLDDIIAIFRNWHWWYSSRMYVLNFAEELQHLIGSETTRQGVMLVFNMFQNPRLNRRLAYVIFEGILETIFADNSFPETFRKLHSESPRVRVDRTNSDSVAGDLRSSNSFARKRWISKFSRS